MAIYVTSDIHGYMDRFFDLLDQVNFSDEDELYILGDIIDRGPDPAKGLIWLIQEAPKNIHFLMGNHEDMMYSVIKRYPDLSIWNDEIKWCEYTLWEPWGLNGGTDTMRQLENLTTPRWRRDILVPWLENLPFYFDVTLGNERYIMIHAGLVETMRIDDDFNSGGVRAWIDIPEFGECFSQNLLWVRDRWYLNSVEFPYHVVFGHTPTHHWVNTLRQHQEYGWYDERVQILGESDYIVTLIMPNNKKRICVDTGYNRQGMLRLDDMKEFYSEV